MGVAHSHLYRDVAVRFDREPGSRYVDIYIGDDPCPRTVGISELIAVVADAEAVIRTFHLEQARAPALNVVPLCRLCVRHNIPLEDAGR